MRDDENIWLRSAAKLAHALGVERLTGCPVALPSATLLDGIGAFRTHLYAAFHSGRTKGTPLRSQAMPISRLTLTELIGVGASSQRAHEAQADVEIQANFAVGEKAMKENHENRIWTQGQAVFELKDYRGQQGKKARRVKPAWPGSCQTATLARTRTCQRGGKSGSIGNSKIWL